MGAPVIAGGGREGKARRCGMLTARCQENGAGRGAGACGQRGERLITTQARFVTAASFRT